MAGQQAYAAIDRIRRTDWADYLSWYKDFLNINPRYQTRLTRVEPVQDHFRLHLETPEGMTTETTRKIIFATGFAGGGGPIIPDVLTENLPSSLYAHTEDAIDFASLRGKTVAVIGAAAAAFDAAGVALENGAAAVHLFACRDMIAATPTTGRAAFPAPMILLPTAGCRSLAPGHSFLPLRLFDAHYRRDRMHGEIPQFSSAFVVALSKTRLWTTGLAVCRNQRDAVPVRFHYRRHRLLPGHRFAPRTERFR